MIENDEEKIDKTKENQAEMVSLEGDVGKKVKDESKKVVSRERLGGLKINT